MKDWENNYSRKVTSKEEAILNIKSGNRVVAHPDFRDQLKKDFNKIFIS